MAVTYPSTLPLPQAEENSHIVYRGYTSVTFEHGNTRQRKSVDQRRWVVSLTFVLSTSKLYDWQLWANSNGYDWHTVNRLNSTSANVILPTTLRYISDIEIVPISTDYFKASVMAEAV